MTTLEQARPPEPSPPEPGSPKPGSPEPRPPESGRAGRALAARMALGALFVGGFLTALSSIFIKLSELPPTATGFYRVFLSAPILFLWLRWERPRRMDYRAPRSWRDRRDLAIAGSFFAANTAMWCWSMRYTSAANGQLIANMTPIYVAIGAFLFLHERFSRVFMLGLALAIAGAAALVVRSIGMADGHVLGDLFALCSSFFWSCYLLCLQRLRGRFTTATIMTWTAGVSSCLLVIAASIMGEPLVPHTLGGWGAVFGLAFVSQAAGQGLITFAMAQLPASFIAVGMLIQPIYALLTAWPVLGEQPNLVQVLGGGVIIVGIVLARRGAR